MTGWQVVGWALIIAVAVAIVVTGAGVGLAISRALWISATLSALPVGDDEGRPDA